MELLLTTARSPQDSSAKEPEICFLNPKVDRVIGGNNEKTWRKK